MKGVFLASGRRILHTRKLNIAETPLPACVVILGHLGVDSDILIENISHHSTQGESLAQRMLSSPFPIDAPHGKIQTVSRLVEIEPGMIGVSGRRAQGIETVS